MFVELDRSQVLRRSGNRVAVSSVELLDLGRSEVSKLQTTN